MRTRLQHIYPQFNLKSFAYADTGTHFTRTQIYVATLWRINIIFDTIEGFKRTRHKSPQSGWGWEGAIAFEMRLLGCLCFIIISTFIQVDMYIYAEQSRMRIRGTLIEIQGREILSIIRAVCAYINYKINKYGQSCGLRVKIGLFISSLPTACVCVCVHSNYARECGQMRYYAFKWNGFSLSKLTYSRSHSHTHTHTSY